MYALVGCVFLVGCAGDWRPKREAVHVPDRTDQRLLREYLTAESVGRRVYHRTELMKDENAASLAYARTITSAGLREGVLESAAFMPLRDYLRPPGAATPEGETRQMPAAFRNARLSIFLELDEPLAPIPDALDLSTPVRTTMPVRYYNKDGSYASQGELTRVAELEGAEDVECPAGTFADCARIRVDLRIWFAWGLLVDWTTYVWLSAEVGEVRRVQSVSGWLLIFPFRSAHEFLLQSFELDNDGEQGVSALATPWQHGAVTFDRAVPSPQIAGMVMDFVDESTP